MIIRRALVIGGTGMLAGCAAALVADGWHVVLPSRRYSPIAVEFDDTDGNGDGAARKALWVEASWEEPALLAGKAQRALGGKADLLVAWVHSRVRPSVLRAVAPLLADGAPVVEVHGSSSANPVGGCPDPVLAGHPTQQVVLGFVRYGGRIRWLTHQEVSDGVLDAVRRALAGWVSGVHQVGEFRAYPAYS
jgi:NAD(P)-dependent dehydrogenase (short-subunit alcohol dehydrogenase family)